MVEETWERNEMSKYRYYCEEGKHYVMESELVQDENKKWICRECFDRKREATK